MDDRATTYTTTWGPTLIKGVPRDYAVVLILLCVLFGFTLQFVFRAAVFVAMFLFVVGWIWGWHKAKKDPEFLTVWIKKLKLGVTKDRSGTGNVYLP